MNRRFAIVAVLTLTALIAAPAAADTLVTRFSDDMEAGAPGWTAAPFWNLVNNPQDFAVFHAGAAGPECAANDIYPDLVTLPLNSDPFSGLVNDQGQAFLPQAFSSTHAWWYGVPQNGTFIDTEFPNGVSQGCKNGGQSSVANGGALTSPSIDLTGLKSAALHFKTWFEIESVDANAFDLMTIEVSTNGGESFLEIGRLNPSVDVGGSAEQPFTSGGYTSDPSYTPLPAVWVDSVFSLNAYVDQHVKIRFNFNTGDVNYNGFRGWMIDDVKVDGVFNDPPVANNDAYSTNEDTALAVTASGVLGNDSDPNQDPITAILVTGPQHAAPSSLPFTLNSNGSFTYTPAANFNGTDSFTYKANDGKKDSNVATVTITVTAVNDPPVAASQSVSTAEDTAVLITLSGSDIDSTGLTFAVVSGPSHGSLSASSGSMSCTTVSNGTGTPGSNCTVGVIYTPALNYNGPDIFTFKLNDGSLDSSAVPVSITISSVNDPPVLTVPAAITGTEGTLITFGVSATDVDGPRPLVFSVSSLPTGATLTPTGTSTPNAASAVFNWTPSSAQGGPNPYLVQFTVSDGQLSDTKVVSITVNDTIADRDGDGVPDAVDNCPDDPNANQVDVCHNSPQPVAAAETVTQVDGTIPVTFAATVTNSDKTDIAFLPPTLFTVNCKVINSAGSVIPIQQIPEAGPFVMNLGQVSRPGDQVRIAAKTTTTFSTTFDLKKNYYPFLPVGTYTAICTYVQFGQTLNPTADDPPVWAGEIQALPQPFVVGAYTFIGFLAPLPGAQASQANTVPVKFQLKDSAGAFVRNCTCTLTVQPLKSDGSPNGPAFPAISTTGSGNLFKYDLKNEQYVFNLSGKSLPLGRVQLQANLHDGSPLRTVNIVVTP